MISWADVYRVTSSIIPLYVAVGLGFSSVRFWKLFDLHQCEAINTFVAVMAVPFLCFQLVAQTDLTSLNLPLLAADSVVKLAVLGVVTLWACLRPVSPLTPTGWAYDWAVTAYMVSALPNTLVIGIPVLGAMYGSKAESLMAQLVVAQTVVWFTLLLLLLELRDAKAESFRRMAVSTPVPAPAISSPASSSTSMELSPTTASHMSVTLPAMDSPPHSSLSHSLSHSPSHDSDVEDENGQSHAGTTSAAVTSSSAMRDAHVRSRSMAALTVKLLFLKLSSNFTLLSSLAAIVYSLLSFTLDFGYPAMLAQSVRIIGQTGLGMAMFSLGLFMANQRQWLPCGLYTAVWTSGLRFLITPALMAALSVAVGLKGDTLRVAIVQAALPQGIAPFVFAAQYSVHPEVISTGVILGTLASLPVLLALYSLLGL